MHTNPLHTLLATAYRLEIATFLDIAPGQLTNTSIATQYQFTLYFVTFGITNNPIFQVSSTRGGRGLTSHPLSTFPFPRC